MKLIKKNPFITHNITDVPTTIKDLKNQLARMKNPDNSYALMNKSIPDERLCITKNDDTWEVYYGEHGHKTGLKKFKNESDACIYFWNKIENDIKD